MTLDKVNNRLFIGHHGNSRYDVYQLDEDGLPARRHADYGIGRNLIGRGFAFAPLGRRYLNFPVDGSFDSLHQRLFLPDNSSLGPPGYRIMVFDAAPEALAKLERGELPEAIAVLGQPHFDTWEPGVGPDKINGRGMSLVDEERQLLFYTDAGNHRVLVWDIDPERFESGMDALAAIGQPDFYASEPGIGPDRLRAPSSLAYDPVNRHLFVMDGGNHRVLVFDVSEQNLHTGIEAFAVIGQDDFESREPRTDLRKIAPGRIDLDYRYHRLFVGEQFGNRILVFAVPPNRRHGALDPDAIAVLGQPDFESTDPAVSRTRLTMPRITVDTQRQLAYVPDGYPAGNRINIFDIHPDRLQTTSQPILDALGHPTPSGQTDFLARSANDRVSPRYWTQARDVALDTVDHRLFVSDNYGHRVMAFELDRLNRVLDRSAKWVLGQPDGSTSILAPGRDARTIKLPLAVEYDTSNKRLFVADTWNDRVLVFDMTPGRVRSGMKADYVLGQADFESYEPGAAANRIFFGSRDGRGIYPNEARAAELEMDETNQRLFVTDGGNHRVLVFDVHPERIENGADAIAVLGQDDFRSTETGLSATRWELPGDLVLDKENQRLFVGVAWQHRVLAFDVHPERLQNGQAASFVIGQADFTSAEPGLSRSKFRQTDGMSYDQRNHHLYVTDKYNHRVLVFDVDPRTLRNQPEALAVVGERSFDSVEMGPGDPRHHPDRLHDPRGSDFDSDGRRLFQSEGLNGRMTVFTMPRADYRIDLPRRAQLTYESLDAHLSTGAAKRVLGYAEAELGRPAQLVGVSSHLRTRVVIDPDSERQSRVLESEAVLAIPSPAERSMLYLDTSRGRSFELSIVNANEAPVDVRFELRGQDGHSGSALRTLAAREQAVLSADELFSELGDVQAALTVTAEAPVSVTGLLSIPDGRGGSHAVPAPRAEQAATALLEQRRVLPAVTTGAGRRLVYVLLNATEAEAAGTLRIDARAIEYQIAPRGVFVHETAPDTRPLTTGFGIARAARGAAPTVEVLELAERRDGSLRSAHRVSSHQEGTLLWGPVNTYPTLLRHGDIEMELSLVNEGPVPATVYLELFDLDGRSIGKQEQIVPLGRREQLSLEDVFGRSPLRGSLRLFSDSEIVATLQRRVTNVVDELIVTDVPLQRVQQSGTGSLIYPRFMDGEGRATSLTMINASSADHEGVMRLRRTDGQAHELVLR